MTLEAVEAVQARLGEALAANRQGSAIDHVLIVLPSYSVSESILSHYGDRIPSLEHRYLNTAFIPGRIDTCELLYIFTRAPADAVLDYLIDLTPPGARDRIRERITILTVDDGTPRSVAAKLLDRPDLLQAIRDRVAGRPALIEPWNVTEHEIGLAVALGTPVNGTRPELRSLGFKSEGRRLLGRAGVPIPLGREDVRSIDDVVDAVRWIREERPSAPGVVIKHDDSGAGDGNVVLDLGPAGQVSDPDAWIRDQVVGLPDWYLADLARGGIVEERIAGMRFASPSAQVDIRPDGEVVVLATHEQVLGGDSGQVYLGCRFPADPAYAPELARHAAAVGRELAPRGAMGRFSIDFVTAKDDDEDHWRVYGLEINLRKGGTTHPYAALRNVVPGRYDPDAGRWIAVDGSTRCYSATDNLVDPAWHGLAPEAVIRAVADAGLEFDPGTGRGAILHMLSGLAIDGRFGLTAIATAPDEAEAMLDSVRRVVTALADRPTIRAS